MKYLYLPVKVFCQIVLVLGFRNNMICQALIVLGFWDNYDNICRMILVYKIIVCQAVIVLGFKMFVSQAIIVLGFKYLFANH